MKITNSNVKCSIAGANINNLCLLSADSAEGTAVIPMEI